MSRFIEARVLCIKGVGTRHKGGHDGWRGRLALVDREAPTSPCCEPGGSRSGWAFGPECSHPHPLAMRQRSVVFRLHFDQPRGGAGEFEGFSAGVGLVERFGRGGGGGVEFDALVVERVDQRDEAFGLVVVLRCDDRDIVDDQRVKRLRNRDEIEIAQGRLAEIGIGKACDAPARLRHAERSAFDYERIGRWRLAVQQSVKALIEGCAGRYIGGDVVGGFSA